MVVLGAAGGGRDRPCTGRRIEGQTRIADKVGIGIHLVYLHHHDRASVDHDDHGSDDDHDDHGSDDDHDDHGSDDDHHDRSLNTRFGLPDQSGSKMATATVCRTTLSGYPGV